MPRSTPNRPPSGPEDPTAAEWRVLRVVWDHGPLAARDVLAHLEGETEWSPSTVKTLLRRLVEKGHLKTRQVGNSFQYSAKRSPLAALRRAADQLVERAGGDRVGSLLAYLVRSSELSDADLAELRALVTEDPAADAGEEEDA